MGDVSRLLASLGKMDDVREDSRERLTDLLKSLHGECERLLDEPTSSGEISRDARLQTALAAMAQHEFGKARDVLESAIEAFPEDPELYNHLALSLWELGDIEGAARWYETAACHAFPTDDLVDWYDPRHADYLRSMEGRALCLYRLERYDEAVERFESLAEMNSIDYMGCRYLAGEIYHIQGRLDEAIERYEGVTQEPAVLYNLGLAYYERGDLEKGASVLIRAFVSNQHIAGGLLAMPVRALTSGTGYLGSEAYAEQFLDACLVLWHRIPAAIEFMRRCFDHPLVRAHVDRCDRILHTPAVDRSCEYARLEESHEVPQIVQMLLEGMSS
jgi:tetratricopeptide (TPR) repeat protein